MNKNKTFIFFSSQGQHQLHIICIFFIKKNKIKHKPNKYTTTKCINLPSTFNLLKKKMKPYSQGSLFESNELPEFEQTNLI